MQRTEASTKANSKMASSKEEAPKHLPMEASTSDNGKTERNTAGKLSQTHKVTNGKRRCGTVEMFSEQFDNYSLYICNKIIYSLIFLRC